MPVIMTVGSWYTCGNCREVWPCECGDPVRICGICGGDPYECRCDERVYWEDPTDPVLPEEVEREQG